MGVVVLDAAVMAGDAMLTVSLIALTAAAVYVVALLVRCERYERERRALARARGRER